MPVIKPSQLLNYAADLFTDESKWTEGAWAKDEYGEEVHPASPDAVCFCWEGAVINGAAKLGAVEYSDDEIDNGQPSAPWSDFTDRYKFGEDITDVLKSTVETKGYSSVPDLNDKGGYEMVTRATRVAVAQAYQRGI